MKCIRRTKIRARTISGHRRRPANRREKADFHTCVKIGGSVLDIIFDTGADVNVISRKTASDLGLWSVKNRTKLKSYGSISLKLCGIYKGPITFGAITTEPEVYIVRQPLEYLMSSETAKDLGSFRL